MGNIGFGSSMGEGGNDNGRRKNHSGWTVCYGEGLGYRGPSTAVKETPLPIKPPAIPGVGSIAEEYQGSLDLYGGNMGAVKNTRGEYFVDFNGNGFGRVPEAMYRAFVKEFTGRMVLQRTFPLQE